MTGDKHYARVLGFRAHGGGFTVMELLVVVLIFALGSLAVSATYINFTRLHRRAANAEALGEELRFVMELVVRAARNNTVEYPSLPGALSLPLAQLNLKNTAGGTTSFTKLPSTDPACAGLGADCLALSFDGGATWTPVSGKNIQIDRFDVYVTPRKNPFQSVGLLYDNDIQPRITFVIDARHLAKSPREIPSLSLQTTVSSRVYLR